MARSPSGHGGASTASSSGGQLDPQQVEHVGGDVVVQRGDRVGHHQRHPARGGPQQHEELVVDVEQAEHRAGGAQLAQLGDGRVEVDEGLGGQPDAAPRPSSRIAATANPGRACSRTSAGASTLCTAMTHYGKPPIDCGPNHNPKLHAARHPCGRRCQDRTHARRCRRALADARARRPAACSRARWRCAGRCTAIPELGPRPAAHPRRGGRRARRPAAAGAPRAVGHARWSAVLDGAPARPDRAAARRHGRAADARGHRAGVRLRGRRARCTPAGTTRTSRCSPRRPGVLADRRDELAGRVLFMFQPGEEGFHGARYMIEEGLLDRTGPAGRPDAAYALHISATVPSGELHVRPGPLMAAADVDPGDGHRPRRARLGPARRARPGARGRGDGRRAADGGHPAGRRPPAGGADHRAHHRGHHQQRHPGDGVHGGHAAHAVRADPGPDARGDPAGLPAHRAGARLHGRRSRSSRATRSRSTTTAAAAADARAGRRRARAASGSSTMPTPIMGAEDFSYVLAEVPGALAFLGGCPPGVDPADGAAQPLQPRGVRRGRDGAGRRRVRRRWRCDALRWLTPCVTRSSRASRHGPAFRRALPHRARHRRAGPAGRRPATTP